MVHLYGGESLHNIIINDLDMAGLELLEYRYSEETPLYLYREAAIGSPFVNVILDKNKVCEIVDNITDTNPKVKFIHKETGKRYASLDDCETPEEQSKLREFTLNDLRLDELQRLINPFMGNDTPVIVRFKNELGEGIDYNVYVAKIEYGTTAGYRYTELTYAGDLIGGVGESITSILDKIKNMLGDFEYFYDLDGQFIFQRKRYSFESTWSPISLNENGQEVVDLDNNIAYTFSDSTLVTAFNNNPDLTKLKNDYSVWGTRKSLSGKDIPVHMRYAIDRKPISYTTTDNVTYTTQDWDWRELIYQMAVDYNKNSNKDDFTSKLAAANMRYYPTGKTGYENYYIDLISFWRDLYDPVVINLDINHLQQEINAQKITVNAIKEEINHIKNQITQTIEYLQDADSEEAKTLFTTTIHALEQELANKEATYQQNLQVLQNKETLLAKCDSYYYGNHSYAGWNMVVFEAPQNLNFWFDFLDTEGELSQYSVKNVGCRPKAINDSNVKAIYFREIPNVLFTTNYEEDSSKNQGYTYININPALMNTMFSISSQGKSAKSAIDELLYQHSYCVASATINTIPIYYLEPNNRIHIVDKDAGLEGYYNISKLSIPLKYDGIMSITATKAAETI